MSYFLYKQTIKKRNIFVRALTWFFIPALLIILGISFITNSFDTLITKGQNIFEQIQEWGQEIKGNNLFSKKEISEEDYLAGIPIKEILRGGNKYELDETATIPEIDAQSYVVGDVLTGEIILEKNADEKLPIASLTKLMTASVALDELKETHIATVSQKATLTESSRGMLKANEQIEVSDLLYPLLLVSSNDAAEVLAETFGRKYFIQSMNRRSQDIGMKNTSFEDPSGLSEYNISTARDLFFLSEYLYNQHTNVFEITKLQEYTQGGRVWKNANRFAGTTNYEGGKTGYTSKAHRTGVALFKIPFEGYGDRVIAVTLLRTDNRAEDYAALLDFVEKHVRYVTPEQKNLSQSEDQTVIKMTFIGDMMFDRGVKTSVQKNFNGDYGKLFENLEDLKEADVAFANLEGPISENGKNVGSKYSFRFPPIVTSAIKNSGIDIVSFANNHVGDWSLTAFKDTLSHLKEYSILFTGAGLNKKEASKVTIIESQGIKIGFLGFSDVGPNWIEAKENEAGQLLASDPKRLSYIEEAKNQVDILIVSYHWGNEYQEHNERQTSLAHSSIDSGADLVIGHHPHVIQDTEIYKNKLIAYSLGNAIFDQHFSEETMQGMLLNVEVNKYGIVSHEEKIFTLNKEYQPQKPESTKKVTPEMYMASVGSFEQLLFGIEEIKSENKNICPSGTLKNKNLFFFNASQKNKVPSNFIPSNLVPVPEPYIPTQGKTICVTQDTLEAFYSMHKDAKEEGILIVPTSGYRSISTQEQLYNAWIQEQQGQPEYLAIALPGHSEHHLGTTLDLTTDEIDFQSATKAFDATKAYEWLTANAYRYGFVQSYPSGKEAITGYIPESWHWRYLGKNHALSIQNKGITTIEYLSDEENIEQ